MSSPDYVNIPTEVALQDFLKRIEHYQEQYEPLDERLESSLSFMKIYNTGTRAPDRLYCKKNSLFVVICDLSGNDVCLWGNPIYVTTLIKQHTYLSGYSLIYKLQKHEQKYCTYMSSWLRVTVESNIWLHLPIPQLLGNYWIFFVLESKWLRLFNVRN